MSSGLMLDDIIMNLFTDITKTNNGFSEEGFIFQNPGWYNLLVQKISVGLLTKKRISDTKKTLHLHHYIEREKLRKYLSSILSMDNDEAYPGKKKSVHQWY